MPSKLDIPIHAFDLIVADECHRGYSAKELSVWRNTLDHFDAIKIGLTATPAAHTMAYFENLVYRYDYERAVREGYLVDYDVVQRQLRRPHERRLPQGGRAGRAGRPETGAKQLDLLEDERAFDATEVERKITAPDSNRKILEEIKNYADEHEAEHGRFPKTLIFAANDLPHTSHADQLVDTARDIFGRGDAFVAKITGRVDRPLQRIREFRNRPNPGDRRHGRPAHDRRRHPGPRVHRLPAPGEVAHPVRADARPRHAQGREVTRTSPTSSSSTASTARCSSTSATPPASPPSRPKATARPIAQIIEEIWQNQDRDYNIRRLVKRLQRIDKEMTGEARELFARFIPDGDLGAFAEELPSAAARRLHGRR